MQGGMHTNLTGANSSAAGEFSSGVNANRKTASVLTPDNFTPYASDIKQSQDLAETKANLSKKAAQIASEDPDLHQRKAA